MADPSAEVRGCPSAVWRAGQDRRLAMILRSCAVEGARILDIGCGLGLYTARLAEHGAWTVGTEIEWARAQEARAAGVRVLAATAEALPFADAAFDTVLLHEVLEHVQDDRAAVAEAVRVTTPGGRVAVFVPNRWWPFETHGVVWRGTYRFGNAPLVNYLPDVARNRLAPHVRVYTAGGLRSLFHGLPVDIVWHTGVYPGYDRLAQRRPRLGSALRRLTYALEATPARAFGLSHLLVARRRALAGEAAPGGRGSDG